MFYLRTNKEPHRDIYLPKRHQKILEKIIETNDLDRNICDIPDLPERSDISKIDIGVHSGFGIARFKIIEPGKDFKAVIKFRLQEISREKISCFLLDMNLSDPFTAESCKELEELGFYFSCIIPEMTEQGDIIRFQYLNNIDVDPSVIKTASDFGKELLDYTLKEREQRLSMS